MGALAAALNKKGASISSTVLAMLETLRHRGSDSFGVASSRRITIRKSLEELRKQDLNSSALIGHNFAKTLPGDTPQPMKGRGFSIVLEGRTYPAIVENEVKPIAKALGDVENKGKHLVQRFAGAFVFAIAEDRTIEVGRDAVGACPLYFGQNDYVCAVASERKALWRTGIPAPAIFPPGRIARISADGFSFETAKIIPRPPIQTLPIETAVKQIRTALLQSMKDCISGVEDIAVAFSGGVDSSLVAILAKQLHADPCLIYVSLEGQKETAFAERAAKALDLPLHQAMYSVDDVEKTFPRVLWLIENPSILEASIAMPLFWIAEEASKLGLRVLATGQGGDELFGGYHRYLRELARHGLAGLHGRIYEDIVSSHATNLERDNKVCAFHNVELRMPLVDYRIVHLALTVPADLKIFSPRDPLRKRVLRKTAEECGIPRFIAEKPKKAIQYTTGVTRALRKLASKEHLTPREYAGKAFLETTKRRSERWEELQ